METPSSFAADLQAVLGTTPYWSKPTTPSIAVQQLADPDKPSYAIGDPANNTFSGAVRRALEAVNPFSESTLTPRGAIAKATVDLGKAGGEALSAAASATQAAGSGISSGFKWATFIIIFGLVAYVFFLAAPFLPKPSFQGAR